MCVGCTGVLVLSEFAGAAQSLGAGAILVNPWNITDMAAAIQDALTMSEQVRPTISCELHHLTSHLNELMMFGADSGGVMCLRMGVTVSRQYAHSRQCTSRQRNACSN
jgi:hypothetical protein